MMHVLWQLPLFRVGLAFAVIYLWIWCTTAPPERIRRGSEWEDHW